MPSKPTKKVAKKATKTAAKAKAPKPPGFATLAPWAKVPLEEAEEFDFLAATNDSVGFEDCFGDDPEFVMIHRGSVKVAGMVELDGWKAAKDAQQTIYILDGDLEVDGPLVFDQCDIETTLWVTGNLTVKRLACMSTAMLIVGGSLAVGEFLVTDLEDAGHLIVHGSLTAPTWIDLAQGRGCIELAEAPRTRFLSDHYAEEASGGGDEDEDDDEEDEDEEGEAHRPGSFACEAASPALLPGMIRDECPDQRKILAAIRTNAPILK
jgi:hypothetical protein